MGFPYSSLEFYGFNSRRFLSHSLSFLVSNNRGDSIEGRPCILIIPPNILTRVDKGYPYPQSYSQSYSQFSTPSKIHSLHFGNFTTSISPTSGITSISIQSPPKQSNGYGDSQDGVIRPPLYAVYYLYEQTSNYQPHTCIL